MTAEQVRAALRARHPAVSRSYRDGPPIFEAWTTVEEWEDIDLLAISAHRHPGRGAQRKADYPWVGYEVKVSRSDLRRELLAPGKRASARRLCHEFCFAVPAGLLTEAELAFSEPDWDMGGDFERPRCPERCAAARNMVWDYRERGLRPGQHVVPDALAGWVSCPACSGRGYSDRSRVERAAPTLWVPRDVGLVEVTEGGGCRVVRKSPVLTPTPPTPYQLANLVRWVSARPDARHQDVPAEQREFSKRLRDSYR